MYKPTREERETIISYDVIDDEWRVFSTHPPHIRRYKDKLIIEREEFYEDGTEKLIDGIVDGSVGVRGRRKVSENQRKRMANRMREYHNQKRD